MDPLRIDKDTFTSTDFIYRYSYHLADVVGVALGLEQLRGIRRQRVLLVNFLNTFLVEPLKVERVMKADVTFSAPS